MVYKALVKDGQGSDWPELYQARQVARRDNRLDDDRHLAVFKLGEDFYLCARSDRDYFKELLERETGLKSQVCTFAKSGSITVW